MSSVILAPVPGETHPHRELINGLLQMAGFLTDHPELPAPDYPELTRHVRGTDSRMIAEVRSAARSLDVEPVWNKDGTHFRAKKAFGPIEYKVLAITAKAMDEHHRKDELGARAFAEEQAWAEYALREAAAAAQGQADGDGGELPEVECADCRGTGEQRDGSPCADCLGKGRVLAVDPWRPEALIEESAGLPPVGQRCAVCEGSGQATDEFGICDGRGCEHCSGSGVRPPVGAAW